MATAQSKLQIVIDVLTGNSKREISKLDQSIKNIGTSLVAMGAAAAVIGVAGKKVYEFAKSGAEIERMRTKFDRLADSIGTTGDVLLIDLHRATRGLYSDAELIQSAGDFMALGLAKTKDEAVRLSAVAAGLGMNMNQLVLTLTNQTTMRFDALGVSVDGFDEKVKELEASGMSANDAFNEAFLRQAEEQLVKVGHAADDNIGKFMKFEAEVANLEAAFQKKLIPATSAFVVLATDMLELPTEKWFRVGSDAAAEFINELFYGKKDIDAFAEALGITEEDIKRYDIQTDLANKQIEKMRIEAYQAALAQEELGGQTFNASEQIWKMAEAQQQAVTDGQI